MKEMLGGCCVCSDESGWAENPLVYCDGQGCTVAVHQACYGIVTVPTGPWYCRKCESTERSARVRCELCPSRDGALKRTEQEGWAHVVCALYIPEVRFRNVTTMEPILLDLIPPERFGKTCYICEEQGRGSRANMGACMQCNKTGCRQQFHVTCAQALGLLCEEAGNFLDNVKYCGYCQHHYSKLKKSNNVKTIPPYKPIPADSGSSDSSAEKEAETPMKSSSSNSGKRRSSNSKSSTSNSKSKSNPSPSLEINGVADDRSSSGRNTPKDSASNSGKFTTSNFVETIVTQSESVFGNENSSGVSVTTVSRSNSSLAHKGGVSKNNSSSTSSSASGKSNHTSKKRKTGARTPTVIGNENSNQSVSSEASGSVVVSAGSLAQSNLDVNDVQQPTVTEATSLSTTTEPEKSRKMKVDSSPTQTRTNNFTTLEASTTPVIMSITQSQSSIVTQSPATTSNSIVVSVPLTATSLPSSVQSVVTSAPTLYQQMQQQCTIATAANTDSKASSMMNSDRLLNEDAAMKRVRSQSADKQERSQKRKRGSSSGHATPAPPTPLSSVPNPVSNNATVTTTKRSGRNNRQSPPPPSVVAPVSSIIQGPTLGIGHFSSVGTGAGGIMGPTVKDSPPSSPGSESMSSTGPGRRKRKSTGAASTTPNRSASNTPTAISNNHPKEEKDIKLFQNGVSAPHMLGNQLNPSSTMAQKMSDTLSQELEAHSIFTEASNSTTSLVGPQLHSRVIASVRSSQSAAHPTSFSNVFSNNSNSGTNASTTSGLNSGAIPQTLEQLLERQWEQGSQFLMDQAQHFDIASLLSCLHQLKAENVTLEERVNTLVQRRDHLLAVNARLAIPLTSTPNTHQVNNIHPSANQSHPSIPHAEVQPGASAASMSRVSRESRVNNTYLPHSGSGSHAGGMENGLSPDPSPPSATSVPQYQHRSSLIAPQPSPTIRHSPASGAYHQGQSSNIISPANANSSGVVRNSSVTPDPQRGVQRSVPQSSSSYASYQQTMSSLSSNQITSKHNTHSHGHGMPGKPS